MTETLGERRFAVLMADTMSAEQRRIIEKIQSGPRRENAALIFGPNGEIRGPFNAMLRSPGIGDRLEQLGEAVRFHSTLSKPLTELAILVTARRWTSQFEWYAHERISRDAGVAPEVAAAIANGERPAGLDREQSAVYDFATELLATGEVFDPAYAAVEGAFGEQGVIDLIALVGYYTTVSFLLNVERHPLPAGEPLPLRPR